MLAEVAQTHCHAGRDGEQAGDCEQRPEAPEPVGQFERENGRGRRDGEKGDAAQDPAVPLALARQADVASALSLGR